MDGERDEEGIWGLGWGDWEALEIEVLVWAKRRGQIIGDWNSLVQNRREHTIDFQQRSTPKGFCEDEVLLYWRIFIACIHQIGRRWW